MHEDIRAAVFTEDGSDKDEWNKLIVFMLVSNILLLFYFSLLGLKIFRIYNFFMPLLFVLPLCNIGVKIVHLLWVVIGTHHLSFLLSLDFLLKVFVQVVWNGHFVFDLVLLADHVPENLLFSENTPSEIIILGHTVTNLLRWVFRLSHQLLAVLQVTPNISTYHHS